MTTDVTTGAGGFLVWVQGLHGPTPQKWTHDPRTAAIATDYWAAKSGRIVSVMAIPADEIALPLDELARRYPVATPKSDDGVEPPVEPPVEPEIVRLPNGGES